MTDTDADAVSDVKIETARTWGTAWNLGDALFWREGNAVLCTFLSEAPVIGPRGGVRQRGTMTTITAPSLAALNRGLKSVGFVPTKLQLGQIAVTS